ncbi:MAG: hypothetical protein ACI8X3_001865 [Saprospiraceae bacterium]|jgi:hypothetical protein
MINKLQYLLKVLLVLPFFLSFIQQASSQDFMLQGWYWDYPKTTGGFNWADTLEDKAIDLGQAGFTYVWLPPLSRASFGSNSNGYDPKDLYDLGEYGGGATGFGTRTDVDQVITAFNNNGVNPVADVVYNHRDGGMAEDNPFVEGWIENFNCTKVNAGDNAYPSDRFRYYLPLGGVSGNGAGTYYFKIRSASLHPNYYGKEYKLYMETNTTGYQGQPEDTESENNGGGDCGQGNNTLQLGVDMVAFIDNVGACGGFCGIDEFQVTIGSGDYNSAGDTLWIFMTNPNGNYSDHYVYGLWDGSADIQSQIKYQTYTDFTNMPSGQGLMNYTNFKPNGNPTQLNGDWDWMWFFYDYDQTVPGTANALNAWSKWLWDDVGIRGFRMDAVKHFNPEYTGDLMDYLHDNSIDPGMVVGEFFDNNAGVLEGWVNDVESYMDVDTKNAIDVRAFDFSMRASLKDACDAFGYDVRNVFNSGMVESAGSNSSNVITFVNNHDFRDAGQPVQNDPMLAYAYTLTNNQIGLPCVFYSDYYESNVPNAPVTYLKPEIDALIQVHQDYIFQSGSVDYLSRFSTPYSSNYIGGFDNTTLLYQLTGGIAGKEVIVAINFAGETLQVDHGVNMTNLSVGDRFIDLLGNSAFPEAIVSGSNQIYIELPARSYSVWVSEPAPLSVELSNFEANGKRDFVALEWNSQNEKDFSGFEIQRSVDGRRFENIAWKDANENGLYLFDDFDPFYNKTNYYRLKMVNEDGTFEYSTVETAFLSRDISAIQLSPNPVQNQTTISFDSKLSTVGLVEIFDVQGNEMASFEKPVSNGLNQFEISTNGLSQGVYFVKLRIGDVVNVIRMVKI